MTAQVEWIAILGDGTTRKIIQRERSEIPGFWVCWDEKGERLTIHNDNLSVLVEKPLGNV